jgi:hypothetical protein
LESSKVPLFRIQAAGSCRDNTSDYGKARLVMEKSQQPQ